ncbi:MAG: PhnD/SsuA/transferrin family substrate-binding protein [Candidatus Limnocylindria bacterium]
MEYRVGAVAYHPRVVTIWEAFRAWFGARGFPLDYVLYSRYPALLDALMAGQVDVAWNTNLAYVQTVERTGGACRAIAMRDTDLGWTSHVLVPTGSPIGLDGLRGRRVGFGDSDSPQAWILPAYAMRRQGLDPDADLIAERLDIDIGKHGDTGGAEFAQLERLRAGELDASVVSDPTWQALREAGSADGLEIAWTTPPFHHCNFTALSDASHDDFRRLLLTMDEGDPQIAEPMRLEYVNRWVEADIAGYADLTEAVRQAGIAGAS